MTFSLYLYQYNNDSISLMQPQFSKKFFWMGQYQIENSRNGPAQIRNSWNGPAHTGNSWNGPAQIGNSRNGLAQFRISRLAHFGNSCFGLAHFRNSWFWLAHFGNSQFGLAHFGNFWFDAGPLKKTFEKMLFFCMFSTPMCPFLASNSSLLRWHAYSAKRLV